MHATRTCERAGLRKNNEHLGRTVDHREGIHNILFFSSRNELGDHLEHTRLAQRQPWLDWKWIFTHCNVHGNTVCEHDGGTVCQSSWCDVRGHYHLDKVVWDHHQEISRSSLTIVVGLRNSMPKTMEATSAGCGGWSERQWTFFGRMRWRGSDSHHWT
jgi:hypothetical protein